MKFRIDQGFTDVWIYRRRVLMLHFCWEDEISKATFRYIYIPLRKKPNFILFLCLRISDNLKIQLCSSKQVYGRKTSEVISIVIKNLILAQMIGNLMIELCHFKKSTTFSCRWTKTLFSFEFVIHKDLLHKFFFIMGTGFFHRVEFFF